MSQDRQVSDTEVFHCAKDYSRALALLPTEFWGHFAIQVACRVSPQSPMVETTTTSHNHSRYLSWNTFGSKGFPSPPRTPQKEILCTSSGNERKNNDSRPFDVLSKLFTAHFFIHEISAYAKWTGQQLDGNAAKFSKIAPFGQFSRIIDYS